MNAAAETATGGRLLDEVASKQMLAATGIRTTEAHRAADADEAVAHAERIGYPVVLKILSPDVIHKSDAGGVALGLADAEAVRAACAAMRAAVGRAQPGARLDGFSVQRQAEPGVEVIIGMSTDAQFGPVLMFGLGGVFVEVLRDVAFRLPPLRQTDAEAMLDDLRGAAVLTGARGEPVDREALATMLLAVSRFVEAHPEVAELDLNPIFAYPDGAVAVDARVVVRDDVGKGE